VDLFKNTTWHTEGNGFIGIAMEFDSSNNFMLSIPGYIINKNDPRNDYQTMHGDWKIINDTVLLTFRCQNKINCDYQDLIFNQKGRKYYENDGMTIHSKNEFSFNKNAKRIFFWGISCKKDEPIISSPKESLKWSTPSITDSSQPRRR
jgi:hypothetical protein